MTTRAAFLTASLLFSFTAAAEEMETDRPDFTEGTLTVEPGRFQLEGGYTFTYDDEDQTRSESHTVPELLVRAGLITDLELRLAWEGYAYEEMTDRATSAVERADGATDLSIGFKHRLLDPEGSGVVFSYIAALGLPVGSNDVSAGEVEPEVKLLLAYDINDSLSAAGNLNFASLQGEDDRFFEPSASASLGYALTAEIGSYLEYFGFYPESGAEEDDTHYLNAGFTWGATEDIQLDIHAGVGLNDDAGDFFTGAGIAWRI